MKENILENKKVLVAEDNAINQMVVKHSLLKLGADADIAGDGAEAIEKFKAVKYDLVLMDIQMPLMDGYEASLYIRNQLQSNVPIIAMTAFALNGEDKKCFECGMNGYVAKPFDIERLRDEIQKVLNVLTEVNDNPYILGNENVAVDLSMLYDISGNDDGYIHKMIQTFLDNMPNTLDNIEQSLQEKDWDKVYKTAHYAKSSLSVIKISEVFDWVLSIGQNAKHKIKLEELPVIFDKVKSKFKMAEQVLRDRFAISSAS